MPKRSRSGVDEQACARGGADEREGRQVDLHRAGRGAFADDEIERVILHRGIEDFLHMRRQAVDLVDEQHVARFEIGEQGRKVAGLGDDGAGGGAEADAHLAAEDLRQRGLAEAGRAGEQDVVERIAAIAGGGDEDFQVGLGRLLAGEIVERRRPQRAVDRLAGLALGVGDFAVSGHGPAFGIVRGAMEQLKNEGRVKTASDVALAGDSGR